MKVYCDRAARDLMTSIFGLAESGFSHIVKFNYSVVNIYMYSISLQNPKIKYAVPDDCINNACP